MTVKQIADKLELWQQLEVAVAKMLPKRRVAGFLEQIANIPVQRSRAIRRLGVYVSIGKEPVCIRLQFAQEPENLRQTFLHEVAHACDHLSRQRLQKSYRQVHGENWKVWALTLGISTATSGESGAVKQLHQQRLKPVGVCQACGVEFYRVRRLNRNKIYTHNQCGGKIQKF